MATVKLEGSYWPQEEISLWLKRSHRDKKPKSNKMYLHNFLAEDT